MHSKSLHRINFFHSNKFSTQLLINFLSLAIIPLVVTALLTFTICYNAILSNSVAISHEITDYATNEINRVQLITNNIAESMLFSSEMQIAMRYEDSDSTNQLITPFHINTTLNLLQHSSSSEIIDIYCFSNTGKTYQSNTTLRVTNDYTQHDWYQYILTSTQPIWFTPHDTSFVTRQTHTQLISYGLPYFDYITGEPNGVILIDIDANAIFNNLNNSNSLQSNEYYILDEKDQILFSTNPNYTSIPNVEEYFDELNSSHFYYSNTLSNHWQVVGIITENSIARDAMFQLSTILVLLLVVFIAIAFFISIKRTKQISEPLLTLIESMDTIHDETKNDILLIPSSTDEIVALYQSFNIMIHRSNEYIKQIKYEQTELRKSQFKALQAQINPHFLYNTMDTIAWNIRLDEKDKAVNAIMDLTKFFRASLRKGNDIINIAQEMEQVTLYLQIQMFRYDDVLDYHITYHDKIKHCIIPKLILQPIVENAIYHGIKNKGDYGHIEVYTELYTDYYKIIVMDDGLGIEAERLTEINNLLENNIPLTSNDSSGYGIGNVNERIKIYYGEDYGVYFESTHEAYTKVSIKLPYIEHHKDLKTN